MRMWMVNPKILCRQHLLGEHAELHMFVGSINRGISMTGYLRDNLLEPQALHLRHDELATEMTLRGYSHKSALPKVAGAFTQEQFFNTRIDKEAALKELLRRCPECRERFVGIMGED